MPVHRVTLLAWVRLLLVLLLVDGCAPIISEYSIDAYKNATSLKAETLALIDRSGEKYGKLKPEIDALTTRIDAAYEFAAGLPQNQLATEQWQLLRNPEGNLYGGLVGVWRKQGTVSAAYRSGKKFEIAAAFDRIICLEVNKKDSQTCKAVTAASQ